MKYISALFVMLFPLTAFAANPTPAPPPASAMGKLAWAVSSSGKMPTGMIIGFAVLAILITVTAFIIKGDKNNE